MLWKVGWYRRLIQIHSKDSANVTHFRPRKSRISLGLIVIIVGHGLPPTLLRTTLWKIWLKKLTKRSILRLLLLFQLFYERGFRLFSSDVSLREKVLWFFFPYVLPVSSEYQFGHNDKVV